MATNDTSDKLEDESATVVIDVDVGDPETEKKLAEHGAPPLAEIQSNLANMNRDPTPGRKVEMTDESWTDVGPPIETMTPIPNSPVVRGIADPEIGGVPRGKGQFPPLPALAPPPPEPEPPMPDQVEHSADAVPPMGLGMVPGDLKDQKVTDALVAAVVPDAPLPPVPVVKLPSTVEAELPELAPVNAKPTMTLVVNDEKTPPGGINAPGFHTGLSLPDQEPVQEEPVFQPEPAKPMPAMPGSRMLALIESEDMNKKDEADPKTDAMELRSFRPAGTMLKSDALLLRSKTEKPFEKTVDELRAAKEKMLRAFDLKERRTLLLKDQWKRRETKGRLDELRTKELASRKALEESQEGLKRKIFDAKEAMKKHKESADAAQQIAKEVKDRLNGNFDKLKQLTKLTITLIESEMKVEAAKQTGEIDEAAKAGDEAEAEMLPILSELQANLKNNRSQYHESRRLELEETAKYKTIFQENKPLLEDLKKLKAEAEPFDGKIREIEGAIAEVEGELDAIAGEIKSIDRELHALEPPEEPAAEEEKPEEET